MAYLQMQKLIPDIRLPKVAVFFGAAKIDKASYVRHRFITANLYVDEVKEIGFLEYMPSGAPNALMYFELLKAMGLKKLISVGSCGSFSQDLPIGSVVSPHSFYNDGGSFRSMEVPQALSSSISIENTKSSRHISTDMAFSSQEMKKAILLEHSIQTVDMEAAAFAGLCNKNAVSYAAIFVVSDLMIDRWIPGFDKIKVSLLEAQKLAISSL